MNIKKIQYRIIQVFIMWLPFNTVFIYTQSFWKDLTISVDFAAAHHDDRTSSRGPRLSEDTDDRWGTWQYGISIYKQVLDWNNIQLEAGLGYSLEHLTYLRSVNHCFLRQSVFCPAINILNRNYEIHLARIPVIATFRLTNKLKTEILFLPLIDLYRKLKYDSGETLGEKKTIDFYSFEVNPGIKYQWNRINIGLHYRIYQIKKIDPIIFFPSGDNEFEDYNPLKFWFSVGYRLGNVE